MTLEISELQELLRKDFESRGLDLVDCVAIPAHGDRMVRLRTIEEAIAEMDGMNGGAGYLIQVRPKAAPVRDEPVDAREPQAHSAVHGVYLPDGRLNAEFLFRNAELLFAAGDLALAKNIYKRLARAGEHASAAYRGLAQCAEAEGNAAAAAELYEEAISYEPTFDAIRRLGALQLALGRDQLASETFERALKEKNLPPEARLELLKAAGNARLRGGDPALAETHYRKAIEIDPLADDARVSLGAAHLATHHTTKSPSSLTNAKRAFQDAIASNPRNAKAMAGLGACLLAEGDRRGAHDELARSLEIDLQNPSAIYNLVKCAYEIKSYATAARLLGDYVEGAPFDANLLYSLAGLQYHLGRFDECDATIKRIVAVQPGHSGAKELASMLARFGEAAAPSSRQQSSNSSSNSSWRTNNGTRGSDPTADEAGASRIDG